MGRLPSHNDFPQIDGELPRNSDEIPQCNETLQTSGKPLENGCELQQTDGMPAQINDEPQLGNVEASTSKRVLPQSNTGFPLNPSRKRARERPISPPSRKDLLEAGTSYISKVPYEQALRLKERDILTAARVGPIGVSPQLPWSRSVTPDPPFPGELSPSDYDEFSHSDQDDKSSSYQDELSTNDHDDLSLTDYDDYQKFLSTNNVDDFF